MVTYSHLGVARPGQSSVYSPASPPYLWSTQVPPEFPAPWHQEFCNSAIIPVVSYFTLHNFYCIGRLLWICCMFPFWYITSAWQKKNIGCKYFQLRTSQKSKFIYIIVLCVAQFKRLPMRNNQSKWATMKLLEFNSHLLEISIILFLLICCRGPGLHHQRRTLLILIGALSLMTRTSNQGLNVSYTSCSPEVFEEPLDILAISTS